MSRQVSHTAAAWVAAALVAGCATVPEGPRARSDPLEPLNRQVFAFNEAIDEAVLKPVAKAYQRAVPELVRTGVSNFFGNLSDAWSTVNFLLQGKVQSGVETFFRVVANSTFGLAGLLDPASEMGLERRSVEDLGQTLGVWGLPPGPYLVLPILGPSDFRDGVGLVGDISATQPGNVFHKVPARNTAVALQVVDTRVRLFPAERVLEGITLDKYLAVRDAYLSRRRSLVYDGDPPDEDEAAAPK